MGIAGDMTVASLGQLTGTTKDEFREKLRQWNFPVELSLISKKNSGISGLYLSLKINDRLSETYFQDVEEIISEVNEKDEVKKLALRTFKLLFKAEGKAHGSSYDKVHLHEAGSWDAIFDIFTASWLIHKIFPSKVLHSPVNIGRGNVKTSHGLLPVPAPAVAELLRGREIFSEGPEAELTTPTGAAILKSFAKEGNIPSGRVVSVGYGLGTKEFPGYPNFLRAFLIDEGREFKRIVEIETEVDDSTGELLGNLWDELRGNILDMFFVPVFMKKGRPGTLIRIIARPERLENISRVIFSSTTTIGLRYSFKDRIELERKTEEVEILGRKAKVKIAHFQGEPLNMLPEFSSCKKLAKELKISVKEACQMIMSQWRKTK